MKTRPIKWLTEETDSELGADGETNLTSEQDIQVSSQQRLTYKHFKHAHEENSCSEPYHTL